MATKKRVNSGAKRAQKVKARQKRQRAQRVDLQQGMAEQNFLEFLADDLLDVVEHVIASRDPEIAIAKGKEIQETDKLLVADGEIDEEVGTAACSAILENWVSQIREHLSNPQLPEEVLSWAVDTYAEHCPPNLAVAVDLLAPNADDIAADLYEKLGRDYIAMNLLLTAALIEIHGASETQWLYDVLDAA